VNGVFRSALAKGIEQHQDALYRLLDDSDSSVRSPHKLVQAARYSLEIGGKRIRPLLILFSARTVDVAKTVPGLGHLTCAIELIHTYSLIHDDLPAMDDDDLRRGKPSLHKAYDEATAILVGDGLQARAFELLADAPGFSAAQRIAMVKVLARAAGPAGMVGGQFIDIQATDSDITLDELKTMHSLKTGALIRASLALGGIAAGASAQQLAALDAYGNQIGLAFQVVDDILDVEGNTATLGKTQGKDIEANKPTYVKLLGLAGAKTEAAQLLEAALQALDVFDDSADHLRDLARYIVERDH
jgi:geranylgeranyl pyrophosphate synthase